MRIFLSAGEASGEHYAVQLIEAIRRRIPDAHFFGLGGQRMQALGFDRIVRAEDVAVMGITEILRHIPRIYREYRRLKRSLATHRPQVAVLIDFPDVNLGLARACRRLQIPVIFFVSPQVWAWKKYRLRAIRRNVDHMLVIFPFEEAFYRERGIQATFIGHPLAQLAPPTLSRQDFADRHGLDPSRPWVGLLPGSRPREIALNLPTMLSAAALTLESNGDAPSPHFLLPLAPTLTSGQVAGVQAILASDPSAARLAAQVTLVSDARATLHHAAASVVASGTATIEAALSGNPFLVVYRVSPLTYAIARRVVTVPHVAMVNLVAGRRLVPELIQHDFTAPNVAATLHTLLNDQSARQTITAGLAEVRALLTATGTGAIERLATATLAASRAPLPASDAAMPHS